jgi:hypothetical protein
LTLLHNITIAFLLFRAVLDVLQNDEVSILLNNARMISLH